MINGQNFLNQPVKNNIRKYHSILKNTTGQGYDYTTGCLLKYPYFKEHKLIAIHLSKQKGLDADPKAIQHINLIRNLNQPGNTVAFSIIEKAKETRNCEGIVNVFHILFCFYMILT